MKGRFKGFFKNNFNIRRSKAKIMLGIVTFIFLLTITVVTLRKTVTLSIDGQEKTYVTWNQTVEGLLKSKGIKTIPEDIIKPSLNSKLEENMEINITKAIPVTVIINGEEHEIMTTGKTVSDVLVSQKDYIKSVGGGYDEDDEVDPSRNTTVYEDMTIKLVQVEIAEVSETEKLPYNTRNEIDYDKDIKSGTEVVQAGVEGKQKKTYKLLKYEDGTEKKVLQSVKVLSEPVDEVVVSGGSYFMASRSGEQIKIQGDTIYVSATAYYCGDDAITATGRRAVRDPNGISTIAVDPSVIPLGSLVYVEGYGKAVAADTGTAIKGNKIDVYTSNYRESCLWGRKDGLQVGIIAYPGEW